jgi:hypothetical protein
MLFNSLQFALFFPRVVLLYFALPRRHQAPAREQVERQCPVLGQGAQTSGQFDHCLTKGNTHPLMPNKGD